MKIELKSFKVDNELFYSQAMDIRTVVFVDEQKVDEFLEFDGYDKYSTHYLIFEDGIPSATARWRSTKEGIKLERFAVLQGCRGRGYGQLLLQQVLKDILPTPKLVYLHAQSTAVSFYCRFGFDIIGKMFLEADIQHFMMIYKRNIA
ncbi:MAG: GNAT family N-acetyltransferase [Bacteroidales bacterium]|nr:GNAT family N-acetyltransferase [Bacteroidales bacterium]